MARWPLIGLATVHGVALLIGTYSTLTGSTGEDAVPALVSLFGFIYFESIIFALGTSIFVFALVNERNEAASKAAASKDSLTGIANRAAFLTNAERLLERCRRDREPASAIMFDLDHFKKINDRHGHETGDKVLVEMVAAVGGRLRRADQLFRIGGEEFVALLPYTRLDSAYALVENLRTMVEANTFGGLTGITISLGVAELETGEPAFDWLRRADKALYRGKELGRNQTVRADPRVAEVVGVEAVGGR